MEEKIDSRLLYKISLLEEDSFIYCIVWLVDYEKSKAELKQNFDESCFVGYYPFLNAVGMKIKQKDLLKLSSLYCVEYVSSIQKASIMLEKSRKDLEINDLHKMGIMGQGVRVAVIDTGCYPHLDFLGGVNRIVHFEDFLGGKKFTYDDNGHGTFVAGVLGGSGLVQNGKYRGVAPQCDLVILKALDKDGETEALTILNAMQWIIDNQKRYDIKIVCMSFGSIPLGKNDPLIIGVKALWDSGIVVVCAAGNDGPNENTIKSPGACPNVITVGSCDVIDDIHNIKVAPFSSRGPAFDFIKPDIIAPGVDIISLKNSTEFYTTMSGTSVSTPFVAGMCALLLSQNPHLSPNFIKSLLMASAIEIDQQKNWVGSGLLSAHNF